jgi:hypothetical protein
VAKFKNNVLAGLVPRIDVRLSISIMESRGFNEKTNILVF